MRATTKVQVTLGRDWRDDVRYLSELRPRRPSDSVLNLVDIYDFVDLVIDGTNLTAAITEESVFGFIGQMMEGLWSLAIGRNTKAIIEFHCEPWELCLTASAEHLLVSLYSVDRRRRVVAHDLRVNATALIASVTRAAEELLADLFAISDSFASDAFVRRFSSVLGKMRRVHDVKFAHAPAPSDGAVRTGSTTSALGATMSYVLDIGYPALRDYVGEQAFDQHALLVPGSISFETGDGEEVVCEGYPALIASAILDRVRELLTFLESSTPRFVCDSDLHQLRLDVSAEGAQWQTQIAATADSASISFTSAPAALLDGLIGLAEMVVNDLDQANERIALNQRFSDLQREVRELRSWNGDFTDANHYLDHPEQFLTEHGDLRPARPEGAPPSFPYPLGDVRALYPRRAWEFRATRINFSAIASDQASLFVAAGDALVAVDLATGAQRWAAHGAGDEPYTSFALANDVLIAADALGRIHFIDRDNGASLAHSDETVGTLIVNAAAYEDGALIVVADFEGGVVGLDRNGRVLWRVAANHGVISGMRCVGPVVCVMSSPGFVHGINPSNGELLWKVRLGGLAEAGPYFHQGRVYTFSHDLRTQQFTVHAMFPFTGRTAWQLRFDGRLTGRPDFVDDHLIAPVERHGQVGLVGINVEVPHPEPNWRVEVLSAGVDYATSIVPVEIDGIRHAIVRTDTGEVTCFRVADGAIHWRVEHASPSDLLFRNLDLALVRDAVLCVGERMQLRDLRTGALLHEFGDVMVAPEFLRVSADLQIVLGERGSEPAERDRLVAWSTQHFLAVVGS